MKLWSFTPRMTELVIKSGCHTHINAEKWSGENLTNLTACYGHDKYYVENIIIQTQVHYRITCAFTWCNGPYAKFLNRAHLFFKRGAGDLIFTTCDCYGLNNVVFNFGAHS